MAGEPPRTSTPYLRQARHGIFYLHWTENGIGRRVTTRTMDRATANIFLARWILLNQGRQRAPISASSVSTLSLADVWDHYLRKHVRVKLASDRTARDVWKNLAPFFGKLPADGFTQTAADDYLARRTRTSGKLGRRVLPQTVRKELAYIAAAVRFCADPRRKIIPPESVHLVSLPDSGPPRTRWLRTDEIHKLFDAAARLRNGSRLSRGERFLWLALETGARKQAILDLEWSRVDFEVRSIQFALPDRRQKRKRRATVPISDALLPVLERAYEERLGDVVMDSGGEIWDTFQKIVIEAGLAKHNRTRRGRPFATGISPHVLRHTAATHMVRRGVPLYIVAAILGNSVEMVANVYGHHAVEDLRDAVNRISGGAPARRPGY